MFALKGRFGWEILAILSHGISKTSDRPRNAQGPATSSPTTTFKVLGVYSGPFLRNLTFPAVTIPATLETGQGKNTTFYFAESFCCFDSTKVCWKQQKQNKQTLSFILHQKLSKFIYQSSRTSRLKTPCQFQKVPILKTRVLVMYERMYAQINIRSYMTKTRVFSFGTFLELAWCLQSTRSRRLVNEFR